MTVSPARRAAFETIRRVFEDDAYADRAFRGSVEGVDPRERALAQRLAYGTIQRVRTLDHGIEELGGRPVAKLDPPVRAARTSSTDSFTAAWTATSEYASWYAPSRSAACTGGSSLATGRPPSSSMPWSSVRTRWIVP